MWDYIEKNRQLSPIIVVYTCNRHQFLPFITKCKEIVKEVQFVEPKTASEALAFRRRAVTLKQCVLVLKKDFSIGFDVKFG